MNSTLSAESLIDWVPLRDEGTGKLLGRYCARERVLILFNRQRDVRFRLDEIAVKSTTRQKAQIVVK